MNSDDELPDNEEYLNNSLEVEPASQSEIGPCTDDLGVNATGKKRNRDMDLNEIWTVVERGKKRLAVSGDEEGRVRIPTERIEICMTSKEKLPKQIGMARLFKTEGITDVIKIKYVNFYKALIQFSKETSAEKLIQSENLLSRDTNFRKLLRSEFHMEL
ncbi:unnamed protein product [Plutella xylostella]|uniref:(diamondback moth) hypothetical protein n=1 Tax=Plutella xylostella TaxID=51655 RepID=A0A8S4GDK1_PLUXY|nr:unnamed protein product [Plutella xylostella]